MPNTLLFTGVGTKFNKGDATTSHEGAQQEADVQQEASAQQEGEVPADRRWQNNRRWWLNERWRRQQTGGCHRPWLSAVA